MVIQEEIDHGSGVAGGAHRSFEIGSPSGSQSRPTRRAWRSIDRSATSCPRTSLSARHALARDSATVCGGLAPAFRIPSCLDRALFAAYQSTSCRQGGLTCFRRLLGLTECCPGRIVVGVSPLGVVVPTNLRRVAHQSGQDLDRNRVPGVVARQSSLRKRVSTSVSHPVIGQLQLLLQFTEVLHAITPFPSHHKA